MDDSTKDLFIRMGWPWNDQVFGGRVEKLIIADCEQLIGCELYSSERTFWGLSWIKMKVY